MRVLLVSMFALTGVIVNADLAAASSAIPATSLGYDISFPQCSSNLPTPVGFGIVGVNDGHPFSVNPCLARELQWATSTLTASPEFYANTANPGPVNNASWPTLQQTPQVCFGANSVACSYDYGWNAARGSFDNAVVAETQIGTPSPSAAAAQARWWLDVESGNAWETIRTTNGPTSAAFANDDAVMQGELAYFASAGVTSVGVYSTTSQWIGLMGVTGSTFAATKAWLTGYGTLTAAQAACAPASASFTGGRVAMIQYPSIGLDGDYRCPLLSSPTSSSVSATSSATFTNQLAVAGESSPVAYVQSTGAPQVTVSSTGLLATSGPLAAGIYTATGTTSANGDNGTFAFSLAVGTITQNPPTSASASVATAVTFTDQLSVTGSSGAVTYAQTSGTPAMIVSPTGLITTSGTLAVGSYVVRGTMSDASGDQGTFFFNLKVGTMTQNPPTSATATPVTSATFTDQLSVTGSSGAVTYVQTSGTPAMIVSPTGLITTSGTLAVGSYVVRGTMSDASGDQGTFFFDLFVGATTPTPSGVSPVAHRVIGHAVAGRTVTLEIIGSGFSGRPTVLSRAGTTAVVTGDSGTRLKLRVAVRPRSRRGIFAFVIVVPSGKLCSVRYVQR